MRSARLFKSTSSYCFVLIFTGFFMTSLSYLSWFYHLVGFVSADAADLLSMGLAYAFQAAGVALFALVNSRRPELITSRTLAIVLVAYALVAAPAALGTQLATVLVFAYALALLCGFIAGFYLQQLAQFVDEKHRALVFGGAYCAASVAQWLLGFVGDGSLVRAPDALVVHTVLVLAFAYLVLWEMPIQEDEPKLKAGESTALKLPENLLPLACVTTLFLSVVKNLGYGFPTTDIIAGVNLELSRLFYAAGLVIAGFVTDKKRQYGAICCLAACVSPFITLALGDGSLSATAIWGLDYFFQGFFVLFRVILFVDIAARSRRWWLAGFGLMLGRIGEALGTGINAILGTRSMSLIALTALLFVLTVFLFFRLMECLYIPEATPEMSEEQRFENFCSQFGLSARERQVLRFILEEKSNSEIASEMFVTEATVKFHVHNLLGKTSCKRRLDLVASYRSFEG